LFGFLSDAATKWILRQDAIKSLTAFIESGQVDESCEDVVRNSSSILLVVKEHTRAFIETNVNIMKAIIHLLLAVCEYHESKELCLSDWAVRDATGAAVQKISDRKLSASCKNLLSTLCIVSSPATVLLTGKSTLKEVRSPIAHEEYLKWCQSFCNDFGAAAIGSSIGELIPWLIEVSDAQLFRSYFAVSLILIRSTALSLSSRNLNRPTRK
jgi:hypothetical protein